MDVGASQQRMAAFLRDNHDKVVGSWSELVAAGLRGRTSLQEARRELEDLYSLVIRELSGTDEDAAGELRAVLDELSRNRARDGFTPSEPTLSVFSLKEAVYELVAETAELDPSISRSHAWLTTWACARSKRSRPPASRSSPTRRRP